MKKVYMSFIVVLTFFLFVKVNALENIKVDNFNLSPRFNKNISKYNVYVNENTTEVVISAILSDDEINVIGTGTYNIINGLNTFLLEVENKDNKINKYEIIVYKNYNKDEYINSSKLSSLEIEGYDIKFNPNILNYYINIDYEEQLNINYELEDDNAKVVLTGNDNLKYKDNQITITVYSKDNKNKTIYRVNVNKIKEVFNNTSNSKNNNNIVMSTSERNKLKIIIISIVFILEFIFYKIFFRKN